MWLLEVGGRGRGGRGGMGDLYGYAAYLMYKNLLCLDGWLAGWLAGPCLVYIYYHSLKGNFVVKR